jgi:hypothetical protein
MGREHLSFWCLCLHFSWHSVVLILQSEPFPLSILSSWITKADRDYEPEKPTVKEIVVLNEFPWLKV